MPAPIHVIVDGLPEAPEPDRSHKTREESREERDRKRLRIELATAILLFVYTTINGFMWWATKKTADAAKASADLARKNAHFDQRAWLSISYGSYEYQVGQPFAATYQILDTGRTPARNVSGMAVTYFLKVGERVPPLTYSHGTAVDLGTMLPGIKESAVSYLIPIGIPKEQKIEPLRISTSVVRALKDRSGYVIVYGKLEYDSVFGAHHWMKFCAPSTPMEFSGPQECTDYNDVDGNEEP